MHQFKRNYECSTSKDLVQLIHLGYVNVANIYDRTDEQYIAETTARSTLEKEALPVQPPPGNQDVRAPINGVTTKRCQEWTMEYLQRLVRLNLISATAVGLAQAERDSSIHGIFGQKGLTRQREQIAGSLTASPGPTVQKQQPRQGPEQQQVATSSGPATGSEEPQTIS
ncbi:hypothetical protein EJ03DRAFT_350668 [Teratosphaeria nubilosa]|uniref:Uncharacterized protein n=1 Tax=Teratosphaeria nubilosa TaxID=161662 RepID=A0A6G1LB20_9PEZI|nr:hypothetical protein EJ03DRAFT_350668 [Teratosphaeria nubilosa]